MHASRDKDSYPWLPPECWLFFGPPLIALSAAIALQIDIDVRHGDSSLLIVALALAVCGVVLLFLAKLPLYRRRQFFTFGPRLLDRTHRRLYAWAYAFIALALFLFGVTCLILVG